MRKFALLVALCLFAPTFPVSAAARAPNFTITAVAASQCADANAFLISTLGASEVGLSVSGTFVQTLQFRGTIDGTNFDNVDARPVGGGQPVSSTTATGRFKIRAAGFNQLCVYASAFTSGGAALTFEFTSAFSGYSTPAYETARVTVQASAAQTATNQSAAQGVGSFKECDVTLNVSAASGTTPSLTVTVQASDDGGTTWYPIPSAVFTAVTAAPATQLIQITNFGDTIRASSAITGTTPSFTYAVKAVCKQ